MRRPYFIISFIATHIFFIFFQIHKHSKIIKFSYQKQKYEQKKEQLQEQLQELTQTLCNLKKQATVKQFAQETLNMKKIKLSQVKSVHIEQQ